MRKSWSRLTALEGGSRIASTSEMLDSATAEKTLPQNLEAERSVLGAILLDSAALNFVVPILTRDDFFPDTHRRIYDAMVELSQRSAEIDVLTLKEELDRAGAIEKAGGAAYLTSLVDAVPDVGQRRALRPDRQGEGDAPAPDPGRPADRARRPLRRTGRGGAARRGHGRDLRHRRGRDQGRLRAHRPGRPPQPRDHRGRPRPAGDAVGPRHGVHRARPDDLGPPGDGPDHHRGPAVGRKDLLRAQHRPARRDPRGPRRSGSSRSRCPRSSSVSACSARRPTWTPRRCATGSPRRKRCSGSCWRSPRSTRRGSSSTTARS